MSKSTERQHSKDEQVNVQQQRGSNQPPMIVSQMPEYIPEGYGMIPLAAQTAINALCTKREAALMIYYMSLPNGFRPSAKHITDHTFVSQADMSRARASLQEKGFINYDQVNNTITVEWNTILETGRVAALFATDGRCNVREVMRGGHFVVDEGGTVVEEDWYDEEGGGTCGYTIGQLTGDTWKKPDDDGRYDWVGMMTDAEFAAFVKNPADPFLAGYYKRVRKMKRTKKPANDLPF